MRRSLLACGMVVAIAWGAVLATDIYQPMIFKSVRVNGGAAGAAGSNAIIVDSPGMQEATRGSLTCSWATPLATGEFCRVTAFATSTTIGMVMSRAGSITAWGLLCDITAYTSNNAKMKFYHGTGTATAFTHAALDGSALVDAVTGSAGDAWTSTGVKKRYVTIARNASGATFAAGEFISVDMTFSSENLATCALVIEPTYDN